MYQGSDGGNTDVSKCFVNFNQDYTSLIVGTKIGYKFYSLKSAQKLGKIYENSDGGIALVERLFSSNLVVTVLSSLPNVLRIHHLGKGTEICRHKYEQAILAVRLSPMRLISMVADGIYIHSLHDMKLLHVIPSSLCESTVCVLSSGLPVRGQDTRSYLAYSDLGDMNIFDTVDLNIVTTINAHQNPVACAAFNHHGNLLATASDKGTVIRIFSIPEGQKLFEFRRGLKRCAVIYNLAFSANSLYLACSSSTDTVHVFQLLTESSEAESWMNYFGNLVLTSASYLPVPGAEVFTQGRDYAIARLPVNGARKVCAITVVEDATLLLVASEVGMLYVFRLQPLNAADSCPLINEFQLCSSAEFEGRGCTMPGAKQQLSNTDSQSTHWCGPLSYASVVMSTQDAEYSWKERQQHVLVTAADVNVEDADEDHNGCLQLDDDNEFPAIGHSAFIY